VASIRKRQWKTNSGEPRVGWAVDFVDSQGGRQRRQFTSRREADDFRIEIEGQLRKGTFRADAGKVTVKDAAELFLQHCKSRMERRERMTRHNYHSYEGHVFNYICPDAERHAANKKFRKRRFFNGGVGGMRLAELTARAVVDFRDRLRSFGLSVATTRKILGTLKLVLGHAISRDLIAINVASAVRVIGRRDEGPKKIFPPPKEALRRLIAAADPDFRVVLIFAAMTGVRAGELHALRWKHLDLITGEAKIETRVDAYGEEDVTKTAAGMRTVPLGADVILELKAWHQRAKRNRPDDLVFPNKRGWYENHYNMVKRRFLPLFDKLAAMHAAEPSRCPAPPARFNWHALRHFAVSCWIDAGLAPKTVQTFAGHSTLAMTMDRYGHLFRSDDHKTAMDAIAREIVPNGQPHAPSHPAALQRRLQEYAP
jgi:integrase